MKPAYLVWLIAPLILCSFSELPWDWSGIEQTHQVATPVQRIEILEALIGVLLFAFGLAALALAAFRGKSKDRAPFYFGLFCGLYGVRLWAESSLIHFFTGIAEPVWDYLEAFLTYVIPLPAILFSEQYLGSGWKSSLRRIRRIQIIYASSAILIDIIRGPYTAIGLNNYLIILYMIVLISNSLWFVRRRGWNAGLSWDVRAILAGSLILALFALNENLVDKQLVPYEFRENGVVMGLFPDMIYSNEGFGLVPGDRILLYTDGIPEATNAAGDFFGDERFKDFIESKQAIPADDFADTLLQYLKTWSEKKNADALDDDVTLVVLDVATVQPTETQDRL